MSSGKKALQIIRSNLELDQVYNALDEVTREAFVDFLDEVFENHDTLFGRDAPAEPDGSNLETFCQTVRSLSQKYVDQPQFQTRWLTHYLLVDVVESQTMYLIWLSKWGAFPEWSLRRSLPAPYRTIVPPVISLIFFLSLLALIIWLVNKEHFIIAGVLGIVFAY